MKIWKQEKENETIVYISFKKTIRKITFKGDGYVVSSELLSTFCCCCKYFLECDNYKLYRTRVQRECTDFELNDNINSGLINEYTEI